MNRESRPQAGGMNRRDFFKAAAVGVSAGAMEKGANAPENQPLDNHIQEIEETATMQKINFPDKFKAMDQETRKLILAVQAYQKAFIGENKMTDAFRKGIDQDVAPGDPKQINTSKKVAWEEFKKTGLASGEYSPDSFFKSLLSKLPSYLAQYGIFVYPQFATIKIGKKIIQAEITIAFSKIDSTKREDVQQLGISIHRDVLRISDLPTNEGWLPDNQPARTAQAIFRNVEISDSDLRIQFDTEKKAFFDLKDKIDKTPSATLTQLEKEGLKQDDSWGTAANIVMPKIMRRVKEPLVYEDFEAESIEHETRHLIDFNKIDFRKYWPFILTTDPEIISTKGMNLGTHKEINPLIIQLIKSRDKAWTLLKCVNSARPGNTFGAHGLGNRWLLRKMVEFINMTPEKYGVVIDKTTKVNRANQIFSQIDVLLENSESLDALCQKIIDAHNAQLGEDLVANDNYFINGILPEPPADTSDYLYKIGIPAALVGATSYGFKKLHDRKKDIAAKEILAEAEKVKRIEEEKRQKKIKKRNKKD
jgi:hypothetical protein